MGLDFSPFQITGADGVLYSGRRPSEVPKPFKGVFLKFDNATVHPTVPPGDYFLGFDAAINVALDDSTESHRYKIKALYGNPDNPREYVTLFDPRDKSIKTGWDL